MKNNSALKFWGILVLLGIMTTGCSYNIPKYGVSENNVRTIKQIKSKINVGNFTAKVKDQNSITCRAAGGVGTPDKKPFEQYIKSALISELKLAGKFDPKAKIIISGYLEEIDFNANIGTSDWVFKLKAISSNSKSIVVNSKYEFEGSFVADKACSEVAQAFVPAVQELIHDIVRHPGFNKLL